MTDEKLAEIEARANAATPGPWRVRPAEYDDWGQIRGRGLSTVALARAGVQLTDHDYQHHRAAGTDPYGHNAAFIAHARSDIPALCEEVRRLRALLGEARPVVDRTVRLRRSITVMPERNERLEREEAILARIDAALRGES